MKKTSQIPVETPPTACQRKTTIGGQALIEGLLMIGPKKKAMAVRKPDGSIYIEQLPAGRFSKAAEIPFIRGSVRLFRQLVTGTRALMRSAEFSEEELTPIPVAAAADTVSALPLDQATPAAASDAAEKKPVMSRIDRFFENHMNLMLYGSVVLGLMFSVGLFILLPNLITSFIKQWTLLDPAANWSDSVVLALIEGLIRISLFIGYLFFASKMRDIRRVWMYHGAEHKTIACYEAGLDLNVENVRGFSRYHPRCGTAFMFIVIIVSIIVFSFIGWRSRWVNLLIRFALVPLVAGIAYEIIRIAGRYDNRLTRAISVPGLWLQRLTTAEPDDSMLEVAIAAMDAVRPELEGVQDKW